MARYKNKWAELPPPPINPRRWGFDPKKGWKHQVSPTFEKAYIDSRLEQLEIEEEMDSEDFSDVDEHAELCREVLVKAQEAKDVSEMDIEAAFAALTN